MVTVTLSAGSVKVDAEIHTPEGSTAESVNKAFDAAILPDIARDIVQVATSIAAVKAASTGEINVTKPEINIYQPPPEAPASEGGVAGLDIYSAANSWRLARGVLARKSRKL